MQEQELFQQYELKGWQPSPYLYKVLGASALFNLIAFTLMAQANFLTGKTCDSPIVSGVCSVLDALYIGSNIGGSEFVSKDYDPTAISRDDEIIMVDLTGEYPPLKYPEGYFAVANPEDQPMITDAFNPSIPGMDMPVISPNPTITNTTPDLSTIKPNFPKPLDKPATDLPTGLFGSDNPTTQKLPKKGKQNKPKTNVVKEETLAENKTDKTEDTEKPIDSQPVKVEINKKPFENLGDDINASLEKKEVDLTKSFTVVLDGTITADGKLDPKKSKFTKSEGDEKMRAFAEQAIAAVGDSGFLSFLKEQNISTINLTLIQNDEGIIVKIISDQKTPERAKTTASGLNATISWVKLADANGVTKLDERSKVLIEKAKITNEGKNFVFDFVLPKADAQKLIKDGLLERAEKKNKQLSNSGQLNKNTSTEAGK